MSRDLARQDRPFSVILFLGDTSAFGLRVARAVLASGFDVRRAVTPSARALARIAARGRRRRRRWAIPGRLRRRLSRMHGGRLRPARLDPGTPIPRLAPDPGTCVERLAAICTARGIDWLRADEIRSDAFLRSVGARRCDLILSAAFPLILGPSLLAAPSVGAVNFHPSLLPRCRGCHPIFWTLASGEPQGGAPPTT